MNRTTAEEQLWLRRTSRRGRWRRVAPLNKGLSLQRLGIKKKWDFVEILNDGSTNSIILSNINSSN